MWQFCEMHLYPCVGCSSDWGGAIVWISYWGLWPCGVLVSSLSHGRFRTQPRAADFDDLAGPCEGITVEMFPLASMN